MEKAPNLILASLPETQLPFAYEKFKEGLYSVSVEAFGWDENSQRDRFMKAYRPEWFYYLEYDSKKIGYLCFQSEAHELHVHLLIVFKEFQGRGFGKSAMSLVSKIASTNQADIVLEVLKNNTQAVELYKKLGYTISHQDKYFFKMMLRNGH